jgi:CheY-like chemotaxis protein
VTTPPVVCPRCGLHFVPDEHRAAAASRPVVLMVEDLEFFLDTAREVLGGTCELRFASTVPEGLEILAAGGIDLLLLDLSLANGQDGRDLLRRLRDKPCPIIAMTAQDESEIQGEPWAELQRLGVDDILRKGMHMGEALGRKVAARLGTQPQEG